MNIQGLLNKYIKVPRVDLKSLCHLILFTAIVCIVGLDTGVAFSGDLPLVSDLLVASGEIYTIDNNLEENDRIYIDRDYVFSDAGPCAGMQYIRTANNDKNEDDSAFLRFNVNKEADVYVAYDSRATDLPVWLKGWNEVGERLLTTDTGSPGLDLYSKTYSAGSTVVLGGNDRSSTNADSMYGVIIGDASDHDGPDDGGASGHLSDYLLPGDVLDLDQWMLSENSRYKLKLQTNGNLVLRDTNTQTPIWKSGTANESASHLILQQNGNLVLRSTSNTKLWSSNTTDSNASLLFLGNDGVLALYDDDNNALWAVNGDPDDPDDPPTDDEYDGGILVPERRRLKLFIFKGGTSSEQRNWNKSSNILWSMNLKNANGVASSDMNTYNSLWRGDNSINDAKRVIHDGKIHIIVTGNGGDAVAMYEYKTKKCIYWSKTSCSSPHDVEYLPKKSGYLVVAHAKGAKSYLELYDISKNNKGRISGSEVKHSGVHSVLWDAEQDRLWAWGGGNDRLKSYEVVFQNGKPALKRDSDPYKITISNFSVGTGHGGAPMIKGGKRYLILAGKDGILQFNTETHAWKVLKKLSGNSKGLSYNPDTGEIIRTRSQDSVYSIESGVGPRQIDNSEIYKARWWFHNRFSCPD